MRRTTPPTILNVAAPGRLRAEQDVRQARVTDHSVPESFTELYDRYYGMVVRIIRKAGIHHSDVDDVAQIILTHFFRNDALSDFDPNYGGRQVQFTSFLSGIVLTYLRHHLDRQRIIDGRNALSLDAADATEETSWANLFGPRYENPDDQPEYDETVRSIHARLAAVPQRGVSDLPALFEMMREQIAYTGSYDTAALSAHFGVAPRTIHNWIAMLRQEITTVLA